MSLVRKAGKRPRAAASKTPTEPAMPAADTAALSHVTLVRTPVGLHVFDDEAVARDFAEGFRKGYGDAWAEVPVALGGGTVGAWEGERGSVVIESHTVQRRHPADDPPEDPAAPVRQLQGAVAYATDMLGAYVIGCRSQKDGPAPHILVAFALDALRGAVADPPQPLPPRPFPPKAPSRRPVPEDPAAFAERRAVLAYIRKLRERAPATVTQCPSSGRLCAGAAQQMLRVLEQDLSDGHHDPTEAPP